MQAFSSLLGRIDVSRMANIGDMLRNPNGLFAILGVVIFFLYGLSVGKTKALISLLAIYVAYVLAALFPFSSWLQSRVTLPPDAPILSVLIFAVFYIVTFFMLSHSMMRHRLTMGEISISKVIIISIVQLGLLASITISLLPAGFGIKAFGPVYGYLAGPRILWAWAVASLIILPFMRSSSRE